MHGADMAVRIALGWHFLEQVRGVELGHDRADAHRSFDIAALLHMVDDVVVVEHERDARLRGSAHLALRRAALDVARLAQADRVVTDGVDHHLHIGGRRSVFPLEDGAHHLLHLLAAGQIVGAERIEQQIGRVGGPRRDRCLVSRVDDRPRAVALVEFEPSRVIRADLRIGTKRGIVRQALEIYLRAECARLLPHPLVKRGADALAHAAGRRRDKLEVGEADIGRVQQKR